MTLPLVGLPAHDYSFVGKIRSRAASVAESQAELQRTLWVVAETLADLAASLRHEVDKLGIHDGQADTDLLPASS